MDVTGKPKDEVATALFDAGWDESGAVELLTNSKMTDPDPNIWTEEEVWDMTEEQALRHALNKSMEENYRKEDSEEMEEEEKTIQRRHPYSDYGPETWRGTPRKTKEDPMIYLRNWRKKSALEEQEDKPTPPKRPKVEPCHFEKRGALSLPSQDGQVDLFEVNNDDSNVFWFIKRNVREMIAAEKSTQMFFDNTCLERRRALDTKKTLFHLARVHNRTTSLGSIVTFWQRGPYQAVSPGLQLSSKWIYPGG